MSDQPLIGILTEIRDHQRQQIDNFEKALAAQEEWTALQKKSRKVMTFMIFAPWLAMGVLLLFVLWRMFAFPN